MEVAPESRVGSGGWGLSSWRLRAACGTVGRAVFFSPDAEGGRAREAREARAKAICAGCPVIRECAGYALTAGGRYGVWGGLSERDRAALRLGA